MANSKIYPQITKDPLPKLFASIAIPSSVGMIFQTMYNVVDTYFAGLISTQALAALSISFPVFFIILALSMGLSQGSSALIAHALGKKHKKEADNFTSHALMSSVILGILVTLLSLVAVEPLFRLLGAEGEYLQIALDYMRIIILGTPIFIISFSINGTLSAHGDTKTIRNALIGGFLLNILLDPWFMYGWLGFPALGVKGIALATIVIELCSTIYRFIVMKRFVTAFDFRPQWNYIKELFHQSYPISINRLLVSAGIFIITYFVSLYGEAAVAAYGIAVRVEQIALLPSIGIGIATLTITGQNYGAQLYSRVRETYRLALKYGLYVSIIGGVLILLFGKLMMKVFTSDPEVIRYGTQYLNVAAFLLLFYIVTFTIISFYQGLKKPLISLWVGLSRQVVLPLIFFPLLTVWLGIWGIWAGMAATIILAALVMYVLGNKEIAKLPVNKS